MTIKSQLSYMITAGQIYMLSFVITNDNSKNHERTTIIIENR